jgi:diguanylate cyclase (GGDEF)-like protein/PAS domain S-box-containing protein
VRQSIIRDISARVERDRSQRIAAEALANIADGVIIADAKRHIISLNPAASRLTGFVTDAAAGSELDATRTLPDGSPIGPEIWNTALARGHWVGQVKSRRSDGSIYAEKLSISTIHDADHKLQYYVAVFNDISDATAHQNRLQHLASHDALTGLVNRPEFQRRCKSAIEQAAQKQAAVVVLFIDLDTFKVVNDRYNHAVGDRLLTFVSQRIRGELRDADVAGRIGGDEFTVLLPDLATREEATAVADRLCAALSQPFHVGDCELMITASIGIAGYPLDGSHPQTLIANADAAMYVAKMEERNAWRFYTPLMRADIDRRSTLATELRQALAGSEFKLVYQPVIEVRSGRIVGIEALLRWPRPDGDGVGPDEFIPVAESVGLIYDIDAWVMQSVCAQIRRWDHMRMPRTKVAINVSARWFDRRGLVECVRDALESNAVAPERVVLEITESAILRAGAQTERTMRELAQLGVGVAIDDFGTGYASMAYLKLPAITHLKIDRSFVAGLPGNTSDAAIVNGMIALARSLGVTTIAEGIETDAQDEFLRQAGCVEAQGYRYAYPLTPAEFEHLLRPRWHASKTKLTLVSNRR